ncbi:hypothetical protein [uncultured Akkermansia sp.]|uniref:hypothetical protein n=1 Tax=uncultured Akkermansia sp. TaxID=512294 RepID=UPI0026371659|nr:hypothetical protein [uncultured Akkermansia sp.]
MYICTSNEIRRPPPLAIQTAGSWFAYGWDLTKNVMELYKSNGTIANSYSYAPFGEVTQRGNITNQSKDV